MEAESARFLARARWVAILTYAGPLVAFPVVGQSVGGTVSAQSEALPVLAAALGVVGIADYGVSLVLEGKLLARARSAARGGGQAVFTAAVVVAAFGASLAVYGLVLTLLGASGWGLALYALCALHGLHLMLRWPRYERAAEGTLED